MPLSETLKPLIIDQCDISALRAQAVREGMRTLRLAGAQKVGAGSTSVAEVLRVTPELGR